jgi:hypothetical protein
MGSSLRFISYNSSYPPSVPLTQQKYEQDMKAIREEMQNRFQQILAKIDIANLR